MNSRVERYVNRVRGVPAVKNRSREEILETRRETYALSEEPVAPETHYDSYATTPAVRERVDETYHEASKLNGDVRERLGRSTARFADVTAANTTHGVTYPKAETVPLPETGAFDCSLGDALARRRSVRRFTGEPLAREQISDLLVGAVGPSGGTAWTDDGRERSMQFRRYPSAGGLYPIEIYPLVFRGTDVEPGLYHYSPTKAALDVLDRDGDLSARIERLFATADRRADLSSAAAAFVFTATFPRIRAKYGPRGYRFALQESGHAAQNLQLVATALGLGSTPWGGYRDDALNDYLGVDGVETAVVYAVFVGGADQ